MFGQYDWLTQEMNRMRREFNDLVTGLPRLVEPPFPAINLWAGDDRLAVTTELPGVSVEDVDISVVGNLLTLKGNRRPENGSPNYYRRERETGAFQRTIELPFEVEKSKVEARMQNGVLVIALPRAEVDKPKQIPIKVGA